MDNDVDASKEYESTFTLLVDDLSLQYVVEIAKNAHAANPVYVYYYKDGHRLRCVGSPVNGERVVERKRRQERVVRVLRVIAGCYVPFTRTQSTEELAEAPSPLSDNVANVVVRYIVEDSTLVHGNRTCRYRIAVEKSTCFATCIRAEVELERDTFTNYTLLDIFERALVQRARVLLTPAMFFAIALYHNHAFFDVLSLERMVDIHGRVFTPLDVRCAPPDDTSDSGGASQHVMYVPKLDGFRGKLCWLSPGVIGVYTDLNTLSVVHTDLLDRFPSVFFQCELLNHDTYVDDLLRDASTVADVDDDALYVYLFLRVVFAFRVAPAVIADTSLQALLSWLTTDADVVVRNEAYVPGSGERAWTCDDTWARVAKNVVSGAYDRTPVLGGRTWASVEGWNSSPDTIVLTDVLGCFAGGKQYMPDPIDAIRFLNEFVINNDEEERSITLNGRTYALRAQSPCAHNAVCDLPTDGKILIANNSIFKIKKPTCDAVVQDGFLFLRDSRPDEFGSWRSPFYVCNGAATLKSGDIVEVALTDIGDVRKHVAPDGIIIHTTSKPVRVDVLGKRADRLYASSVANFHAFLRDNYYFYREAVRCHRART